jgi:cell division ATPase FtsA
MYSTAVGLILEGFKQEKENKKPRTQKVFREETAGEETDKQGEELLEEKAGEEDANGSRLINRMKRVIESLFEEGGAEMDEE